MTKSEKRNILKPIIILSFIAIFILLFLISYFYFIKNTHGTYENSIVTNIDLINNTNNNMDIFISSESIQIEKCKEKIPTSINTLIKIRNTLKKLTPSEKYKNDYTYLINGLENNVLIYKQILAILNNPNAKDLEIAIENLKEYRNSTMNNYALLNVANSKITLPTPCLTFIDNTIYFAYKSARLIKDNEI